MNTLKTLAIAVGCALSAPALAVTATTNTLIGWAELPAATFSDGPTSGQFAFTNAASPENDPPWIGQQSVQGFSGILAGAAGSYRMLVDNGFGSQANSADNVLRMYAVQVDFRTALSGSGTVSAANWNTGAAIAAFDASSRLNLNDANGQMGFTLQADYTNYYNNASNPAVDSTIKSQRLLTGADLDIEGVRQDKNGNFWFGDEFGPYLVKTDANGTVLRSEISLPGVYAPQHKDVVTGSATSNLGGSGGFEGLAINPAGDKLYALLEKSVAGDPAKSLRINEFDIDAEAYTSNSFLYQLELEGTAIGDMTAIDDHRFLVIERNGGTDTNATDPFKKVFMVDIAKVDAEGFVEKTEVVDLMNIADPDDLNGDGLTTFTFPYVTIEDVLILDANTIVVVNDNNFPGGGGRSLTSDNTEFLMISLANPVPEPETYAMFLAGLGLLGAMVRRRR